MVPEEKPIRIKEVEEILGVSKRTIGTWIKERGMPVHKMKRLNFFYWSEINEWIKEKDEGNGANSG